MSESGTSAKTRIATGFAEIGSGRVFWRRAGVGPSVVLLHINRQSSELYLELIEHLAGDFDVLAFDLPGYGLSDPTAGEMTMRDYADSAADVLSAVDMGPSLLLGEAFGAALAVEIACATPEAVRGLVLLNLPPADAEERRELIARAQAAKGGSEAHGPMSPTPSWSRRVEAANRACGDGCWKAANALSAYDLQGALQACEAPARLVTGDFSPFRDAQAMARDLLSAPPVEVLPGARFAIGWERAAEVAQLTRNFAAELPGQSAGIIEGGKTMTRNILTSAIAITAALGLASAAAAFQDESTVRIGSIEAQTGVPAPYGIQALVGSQIAIDEINEAGGVEIGDKSVKLQLTPSPDGYDPGGDSAQVIALMKKLIADDQVLVIKGTSRSNNTEAAFNYLNELERQGTPVVLLSSAAAAPGLGAITKWGFRNSFFEADAIARAAEMLAAQGNKTAAIFVAKDNAYNAAIAEALIKPALEKAGLELIAETDGLEKDTDYSSQVQALRRAKPDVVAVSTPVLAGVNLMKEAQRRGFEPKAWLGNIGNIAPEVPTLGGPAVEHMVVGSSYSPDNAAVQKLAETFKERTGNEINLFGVNGYEAIYLFKAALEAADISNTPETLQEDREKFRDALAGVEIESITGETVKFDENGDAVKDGYLITIKDGSYVTWDEKPFN